MKFLNGAAVVALLFFSAGCKKDKDTVDPTPSIPVLLVKLNPQYLAGTQVDSAVVVWKTPTEQRYMKMLLRNDSLIVNMDRFTDGNGEVTLHIFSNKKYSNQYDGEWLFKKTVSLQKTKAVTYNGPSSFFDADWFPRVELSDVIGNRAIVALRPDDAYFIVQNNGQPLTKLSVDRGYWKTVGGIALAGRGVWECTAGCLDMANDEYFKILPQRIGQKPWNHISIAIRYEVNDNGEGWLLQLEHEP